MIADAYPEATVMFADLVDFTARSGKIEPEAMVQALDDLFTSFDESPIGTGWRRSRRSATPTWPQRAFRSRGLTMPRLSP